MTSAEYGYRGGKPSEPRTERSRRTVQEFWAFEDGRELPARLLETLRTDDGRTTVEVVDFGSAARMYGDMPEVADRDFDHAYYPKRRVPVVKMRRVAIEFDEARAGYTPMPLAAEVGILPSVLPIGDPRPARGTVTQTIVEPVTPAKTSAEQAA
jgi:hypothetical protein